VNQIKPETENIIDPEQNEISPVGREVDFYLYRHAEAGGEGVDDELTPKGIEQAQEAAKVLLEEVIQNGGGVIKFISSPVLRAKRTAEIMRSTIQDLIIERKITNVRLMASRDREELRAAGLVGPLKERGIKDPVDYWLNNPDTLEGKSPTEIAGKINEVTRSLQKLTDRLPAGEKIYYIGVTHEVPQAALLNQISGKTLNELGGNIKNCEPIKIGFIGKSDEGVTVNFRDLKIKV